MWYISESARILILLYSQAWPPPPLFYPGDLFLLMFSSCAKLKFQQSVFQILVNSSCGVKFFQADLLSWAFIHHALWSWACFDPLSRTKSSVWDPLSSNSTLLVSSYLAFSIKELICKFCKNNLVAISAFWHKSCLCVFIINLWQMVQIYEAEYTMNHCSGLLGVFVASVTLW